MLDAEITGVVIAVLAFVFGGFALLQGGRRKSTKTDDRQRQAVIEAMREAANHAAERQRAKIETGYAEVEEAEQVTDRIDRLEHLADINNKGRDT